MFNFFYRLKSKPFFLWGTCLLVFLVFIDLFFFKEPSNFLFLFFTFSWWVLNKKYHVDGGLSVITGLFFLTLCPFFMLFNENLAERAAEWSYVFLLTGVIIIFFQMCRKI